MKCDAEGGVRQGRDRHEFRSTPSAPLQFFPLGSPRNLTTEFTFIILKLTGICFFKDFYRGFGPAGGEGGLKLCRRLPLKPSTSVKRRQEVRRFGHRLAGADAALAGEIIKRKDPAELPPRIMSLLHRYLAFLISRGSRPLGSLRIHPMIA